MLRGYNRRVVRLVGVGVFFLVCCIAFLIRLAMLELTPANIGGHPQDGTKTRTEVVKAVRGQIYDRNGVPLVTNAYTYDLTFDYSRMPESMTVRGQMVLEALQVLEECGQRAHFSSHGCPFERQYPDITYAADATQPDTAAYRQLISVIESSGLRASMVEKLRMTKNLSRARAQKMFDEDPLQYATADTLVKQFEKKYQLTAKDASGAQIFTEAQVDQLLRVYWGMEATGFSRVNDYTLATDVSMETITCEREKGIAGIGFTQNVKRVYAYPGYASHILGQTGPIYAEDWPYYKELGYNMNAIVGISGCEAAFESYLHGQDGVRIVKEDDKGRIVDTYMKSEAVAGKDIYLTIDIQLQIAAEDALRENVAYMRDTYDRTECQAGAAVALDPNTGEVLALASYPSYNLETFSQDYETLRGDAALPLYNRALFGQYAPGSTFKPGVAAMAMTEHVITPSTTLECAGVYRYYQSYQPACWVYNSTSGAARRHGWINVSEALRVSCNCYFYDVGRQLGIETMNHYCALYGLGQPTGIELGEANGILAGPDYRAATHGVSWQATDTIAAAIGQSDNAFTPLQIAVYMSTLANGGTRYQAHLLYKVRDFSTRSDLLQSAPHVEATVALDETGRRTVLEAMESAVSTSTEVSRFMSGVPVRVAGKTGTAQLGGANTDNGLFVCCAPAQAPEIVVAAVIERAGGGSYASFTAGRILGEYYR